MTANPPHVLDEGLPIEAQRTYYDKYWAEHEHRLNAHEVLRLAEIFRSIAEVAPDLNRRSLRICDLGCGRGWLSNELSRFGEVTAVDLSPSAVRSASERWPHVRFEAADITKWRPDAHFDLVVSSEVIEHVPDQSGFAETVRYLLRNGGHLVLTTPNRRVKPAWDSANMGQQLVEQWLTMSQLRYLLGDVSILRHECFLLDFSYVGRFRFTSAPRVLRLLKSMHLERLYDLCRQSLQMGLYQVVVAKYSPTSRTL